MRVAVFPSDNGGCGWYRLRFVAKVLQDQGHDVQVAPLGETHGMFREVRRMFRDGSSVLEAIEIDADVLVFQRCITERMVEVVAQAKAQGHRVVMDVDDDLDALPEGHPYRLEVDGSMPGRHGRHLHAVCQLADVVTCTTPALAERYGYGKAVVLPNLVPEAYLSIRGPSSKRARRPLVGWTGNPLSHIGDLGVLGGQFGRAVADAGGVLAAWGVAPGPRQVSVATHTLDEMGAPAGARREFQIAGLASGEYARSVARLGVGLVPLLGNPFNTAKSWLKGVEYAALGVPFVASPLPEYERLAGLGVGLLARSPGEWVDHVCGLLGSPSWRAELAESGRAMMAGLTYEAHAGRWLDAWTGITTTDGESVRVKVGGDALTVPA